MSADMTSVRESCVTSLRNRDTAWHCAWIRTPALHLSQGLTADKRNCRRTVRRIGHRCSASRSVYVQKKRLRRIAGAVAGSATALTFLLTRLGVAYTISLRLSKRPRSGRVTRSACTLSNRARQTCSIAPCSLSVMESTKYVRRGSSYGVNRISHLMAQ